ncbi:unnamed protein product [Caenorhabditis auriculariae]|uniref:Uncharacterized protein n=1 Tax=Caenorhabditis auriculariae TaxID=2777116 RepID=A0A8S1GTC5_9PELO|nr:unnamed protein product [Caenorhabditis auriculariae]
MEIFSFFYPFLGVLVHCFELYLIIWKTPKFVQSKVPQAIRAALAIPINFMTQDSGYGFWLIPELGEKWMTEKVKIFGDKNNLSTSIDFFAGLVTFSPIILAAILHIQYANLRCVTLDEFKKPLWKYRLNVGFIYFFSTFSGLILLITTQEGASVYALLFCLLIQFIYTFIYVSSALKFSWDIWENFNPFKGVNVSENTRKMQRKVFLSIQIQLLAIPINYITDESGLGFSLIPDLGDDWLDGKMKFLGEDSRYEIDHYFLGLVWVSPINLAAILHIQYANLRCVTLDEFKQPLWRYRLNVGFIYFFSVALMQLIQPKMIIELQ